jgi:predicted 2-oxoglutarate/Fe(II)-dependent dioxygenase YbiX
MDETQPNTHICVLDNVVSNTLCDEIITFINTSANIKETRDNGSNVRGKCCFPCTMGSENGADIINEKIYEVVAKITHKLMDTFPISVSAFTPFQLRKIHGATKIHIDGIFRRELMDERGFLTPNDMRELTVIIGLNDDYEGGELHFPEQKNTMKLKRGQAIAFPPYWTHPHYTDDLLNNTVRYTIITWLMK